MFAWINNWLWRWGLKVGWGGDCSGQAHLGSPGPAEPGAVLPKKPELDQEKKDWEGDIPWMRQRKSRR